MKFNFTYDWRNAPAGVRLDSLRDTWADLMIGVDGRFYTANRPLRDSNEKKLGRNFVAVSVFPLAEFIAANWWPLLYEPWEKALLIDRAAFEARHWIDMHTEGFAYPNLGFFGADSSIRIVAKPIKIAAANIEFTETTSRALWHWEGLERYDVENSLLNFLHEVAERLAPSDDKLWLDDLLSRIRRSRSDPEELMYCRFAGLLGEDPYCGEEEIYYAITQTVDLLGEDIAAEMFATSERGDVVARAMWLQNESVALIQRSHDAASHVADLKVRIQKDNSAHEKKPWERGYSAARKLRTLLNVPLDQALDAKQSISELLFGLGERSIATIKGLERSSGARGVLFDGPQGLGLALSGGAESAKFQSLATFADFLFSGENDIFLSTRAGTDRQKSNRAFAAEALAPIDGIRDLWIASRTIAENEEYIARQLGVSKTIVKYQVLNQAAGLL